MKGQAAGSAFSAVFVDYDNIYLSLKRKNEDAAKRFAKDAGLWISEIASGRLITPTNTLAAVENRRIVMSRCYGNPVPRRNNHDNSTDMNSFPFVRHHFLRAGFEAVDCPPLTAQLKNSADIRMVMDVRDYLLHDTYFDEFIILSGDADFTPVLHRLRAHARRTVIFANDNTAAPYTAIADGEIQESSLIGLLLAGRMPSSAEPNNTPAITATPPTADIDAWGKDIVAEVVASVRSAPQPVPLEALADRAVRSLGHDRTAGSGWGGMGSFRELLDQLLPSDIRLSPEPPYFVFDASRQVTAQPRQPEAGQYLPSPRELLDAQSPAQPQPPKPAAQQPAALRSAPSQPAQDASHAPAQSRAPQVARQAPQPAAPRDLDGPNAARNPQPQRQSAAPAASRPQAETPTAIQQSVSRIYDACQAPALSPPEYRALFDCMSQEITANGLSGSQTLTNISERVRELGIEVRRDDVRFVLEVVSEADPWFEQGASPALFAGRFRNFVVARCRGQGLNLSLEELDLIDSWFTTSGSGQKASQPAYARSSAPQPQASGQQPAQARQHSAGPAPQPQPAPDQASEPSGRWWSLDDSRTQSAGSRGQQDFDEPEEFPRIVKNRLRG